MTITTQAQWKRYETRRGVPIFKRIARTGTACGLWQTPGTYHDTLRAARDYVDSLETKQFVAPGIYVD